MGRKITVVKYLGRIALDVLKIFWRRRSSEHILIYIISIFGTEVRTQRLKHQCKEKEMQTSFKKPFILLSILGMLILNIVQQPPTSAQAAAIWEVIGVAGFSPGSIAYAALALDNGTPYIAYTDIANANKASLMKFNGITWVNVGTPGFSAGLADSPSLVLNNGTPYVAYIDGANGNKATVMKFDGTAWVTVGTPGFSAGVIASPSLAVDNGIPYLAYQDLNNGFKATVMKFDGTAWVALGTPGFSAGWIALPSLALDNGTPYVAYRDGTVSSKLTVMKYNGNAWIGVGTPGFSTGGAGYPSLGLDNGTPYVAYVDNANNNKAIVMKFDGTTWVTVGVPGFSTGQASFTSLAMENGTPYVAYTDVADGNKANVMKFDGVAWIAVGEAGFLASSVDSTVLAIKSGTLYLAYRDFANSGKASVMRFVSDVTPPDAPILTAPPAYTKDTTPTIHGTAETGSLVDVWYVDDLGDPVQICQDILVDGASNWSCDSSVTLPAREIELAVNATDNAGNTSNETSHFFTVDVTAPDAPLVTSPSAHAYINDATPTISGRAEAHALVHIWYFDNHGDPVQVCRDVPVNGSGTWSCDSMASLPEREIELNLIDYDKADNPSDITLWSTTVDWTVPEEPVVVSPSVNAHINDRTSLISGTAESNSWINIWYFDDLSDPIQICQDILVDGLGDWSCASSVSLPERYIELAVNATDGAGNISPDISRFFTVDLTAPEVISIVRASADLTTAASSVDYIVTFSEHVTNVDLGDFTLNTIGNNTGSTVINVTGSNNTYVVTAATGSGIGTIRLDVVDNDTIRDQAGNPLGGVGAGNGTYTNGEEYKTNPTKGVITTGVFRPSNGALYLKNTNDTGFADIQINYGVGGDYPIVGDWDGDGDVTIGIYRNGSFYLRNDNSIGFADLVFPFGAPRDQPIAGDWDGDGIDTIGVYRSSTGTFYLRNHNSSGVPDMTFALGIPGDVGIAGDWNNDGLDTTGVFRPSNGALYLKNTNVSGFADLQINYGLPGDFPVVGDWDGDGDTTIGIYRNGSFYLRNSNTIGFADIVFALGVPGDMPIAGNWDGNP
jgi:hypothetical protein